MLFNNKLVAVDTDQSETKQITVDNLALREYDGTEI